LAAAALSCCDGAGFRRRLAVGLAWTGFLMRVSGWQIATAVPFVRVLGAGRDDEGKDGMGGSAQKGAQRKNVLLLLSVLAHQRESGGEINSTDLAMSAGGSL